MISMLWAVLRERRYRATAIGVLTAIIVAIAVAAPAYIDASEQAMIRNEIGHATTDELNVAVVAASGAGSNANDFEQNDVPRLRNRYMDTYFGANIDTMSDPLRSADGKSTVAVPYLMYREDFCAHVVIVAGRCAYGTREVVIAQDLATLGHLGAGSSMALRWAHRDNMGTWIASGPPVTMSIVGVYRPADAAAHYWGSQDFFSRSASDRNVSSPVLTVRATVTAVTHDTPNELQVADSLVKTSAVTPATIPAIRRQIAAMTARDPNNPVTAATKTPALLDRVDRDRQSAQIGVAIGAVPLVILGCLALFVVVAYGLQDRRSEVGVIRLRGVRLPSRWWLGAGEVVVPVAVGLVAGVFGGLLVTLIAAAATVPGSVHIDFGPSTRIILLYVVAAILVAILAAHWRTLSSSVADLLRTVPSRSGRWRAATLEIAAVAFAVAAVVQLKSQTGPLTGVTLLAPGLVLVAVAVLAARLVPPLANWVGARALGVAAADPRCARRRLGRGRRSRSARLGLALGALALARRPGAARLMTVNTLAIGILTLTVSAALVQSGAQRDQVRVQIGADRVLSIASAPRRALIDAVDKVDPEGRFAMLTTSVPANVPSDPPLLAVDASRLARVAAWPQSSMTASRAAQLLTASQPQPVQFTGTNIELRLKATPYPSSSADYRVIVRVVALGGSGEAVAIDLGPLRSGDHAYTGGSGVCAEGCRIVAIGVSTPTADNSERTVVLEGMRVLTPAPADVDLNLADSSRWTPTKVDAGPPPQLSPSSGGLQMTLVNQSDTDLLGAAAVNVNGALPVVTTGSLTHRLGLVANQPGLVNVVGTASALPRFGIRGALVDLRAYDAASGSDTDVTDPEIWLNAAAPKDVLIRLRDAGVMVIGERNVTTELRYARLQGPSVGMRFDALVGVGALVLAVLGLILMAAVDRRSRAAELRVLRVQGLPASAARRAAFVGHAGIAVIAGVIGGIAALASWLLVSTHLPIFAGGVGLVRLATTPPWYALVIPALAGAVVLAVTAAFAAADVSATVRRNVERGSAL